MKENPKYSQNDTTQIPQAVAVTNSIAPLAIVSSLEELMEASNIQEQQNGIPVLTAKSTDKTVKMLQDTEMLSLYNYRIPLDGGDNLYKIGQQFTQYKVPVGMLDKLRMLAEYKLDFIVDDSYSMNLITNVDATEAIEPVKTLIQNRLHREPHLGDKMSRLEEAENRLHTMISILTYFPVEHMQVRFLNSREPLVLDRTNKTPEEFEDYAHNSIRARFAKLNLLSTPVYAALQEGFNYKGKWCHYLFNDGKPNEDVEEITRLIINRNNPANHALTLISCTEDKEETKWMQKVDQLAQYVAEVDDFEDETTQVAEAQGAAFPFTKGLWLLCQLVAAINPSDLDALDENLPLSKFTMDDLMGRQLNPNEYQYLFENNPNAFLYISEYQRFLTEEVCAKAIIPTTVQEARESKAGYIEGARPNRTLEAIGPKLSKITDQAIDRKSVV